MMVALALETCTATRKFEPGKPGLEITTGTMPTGFVAGGTVPDPVAITASVLFGDEVPDVIETFVAMSPENATRPLVAPGERPAGLPQPTTRAIPMRSPV